MRHSQKGDLLILLGISVTLLQGCEELAKLKQTLRGQDTASLHLTIDPTKNITIMLDGVVIATRSPHTEPVVAPGKHTLDIRAEGYHPFSLPLELVGGQQLDLPIALRLDVSGAHHRSSSDDDNPLWSTRGLPFGVEPMTVEVIAAPAQRVKVDNATIHIKGKASFNHLRGTIVAGDLHLTYRRLNKTTLELSVPNDKAVWQRDNVIILAGNSFHLRKGKTHISRIAPNGSVQTLSFER